MVDPSELTETLRTSVGDDLRMVGVYSEHDFDHLYLRDELADRYEPADLDTLRREIIVLALGREKVEDVTSAGPLRRIVYETEDAFAVQVPFDGHDGVFVSIDADARSKLFDVADAVETWTDGE
ncbi:MULTISPECIES: DUF7522 family protein [Halorussus]|uniref:DUF7522 family protein n=1 Tax=Halorussus TaxID=1070314 RepID=UPI00209E93B8|nr:hypothetical protein [Halorussus vallis]USZ74856.1 hypothetical protein NGM07_15610 [Halorussus vallis]